jgi:hypothetical protein
MIPCWEALNNRPGVGVSSRDHLEPRTENQKRFVEELHPTQNPCMGRVRNGVDFRGGYDETQYIEVQIVPPQYPDEPDLSVTPRWVMLNILGWLHYESRGRWRIEGWDKFKIGISFWHPSDAAEFAMNPQGLAMYLEDRIWNS